MKEWIEKHGTSDRKALIDYANSLIMHYGEASGSMACELYDSVARASGVNIPSAEPAPIPKYGEVAKAVNGAMKISEKVIPSVVARMTKQVGADTTLHNAERDGAQFAWIPSGDTCAFCITLASRGWQYISKKTLKNGHAEHIHANCDCQYTVRFDSETTVEGYDPEKYLEMYENAKGNTSVQKIKSLRHGLAERKRQLILDKSEKIVIKKRNVTTYLVKNSKYNIHVSENSGLKRQAFDNIEKSISAALNTIGNYDKDNLPNFYVLRPEEININGTTFALYNLITNELYLSTTIGNKRKTISMQHILGFAKPKDRNSTTLHELLHWNDAVKYKKVNGKITRENLEKYLNYQNQKAIIKLKEAGVNYSNIRDVCKYANDSYMIGDFDEAYTEYRVLKGGY